MNTPTTSLIKQSRAPPTKFKSMPTSPALLSSAGFEISAESLRSEPTVLNSFINVGEIVVPSARGTSPQHLAPSSTRSSAANMSRRKKSGNVSAVLLLSRISPAQAVNITLGDEVHFFLGGGGGTHVYLSCCECACLLYSRGVYMQRVDYIGKYTLLCRRSRPSPPPFRICAKWRFKSSRLAPYSERKFDFVYRCN
ncbi:hypothetical protein T492DRAFT_162013 [Pavlovales sp. CCMP2436]|nr:hypothetical protein T492DRAFT_162013 [Pavlovales sp. CCMP2436]